MNEALETSIRELNQQYEDAELRRKWLGRDLQALKRQYDNAEMLCVEISAKRLQALHDAKYPVQAPIIKAGMDWQKL